MKCERCPFPIKEGSEIIYKNAFYHAECALIVIAQDESKQTIQKVTQNTETKPKLRVVGENK